MAVAKNLLAVRAKVAEAVAKSARQQQCTLVAVSKTKPVEDLQEAYEADQRHFGENYVRISTFWRYHFLFVVLIHLFVV